MNKPVIVWEHRDLRLIATEDTSDGKPLLLAEVRILDALNVDSWRVVELVELPPEASYALIVLMQEIALRNDVLPKWVRDFIKQQREEVDTTNLGGAS